MSILQLRLRGFKHISTVALAVPELDTEKASRARFDFTIRFVSPGAQNGEAIDGQRSWSIANETRQRDNMSKNKLDRVVLRELV